MTLGAWKGGRSALVASAVAGIGGLAATGLGVLLGDPRRALTSYLVAFVYWIGLAVAALILLGTVHATRATWPVVLRRFLETVPSTMPLFVVLFVPILLGMRWIFPWVDPSALPAEAARSIEHKRPYLNVPFFVARAAIYFALWTGVGHLLRAWSLRQDSEGGVTLTRWQRRLGAGALPFLAWTMSFAAFDWMMSIDPGFYSTIFGIYWFSGSFMGAFAIVIVAATLTRADPGQFGAHMGADHYHSLGKYLLSFVAFWGYIAFSQFMLIWIANVPEEVPWYVLRTSAGWFWVGSFLAVFQFLVPFFLLLSRPLKRDPRKLAWVAAWLLLVHWVDVYWLVFPHVDRAGPRPSLWDVAAFVGVGGVAVAFVIFRMRGVVAVPVGDPYLDRSLRYLPP